MRVDRAGVVDARLLAPRPSTGGEPGLALLVLSSKSGELVNAYLLAGCQVYPAVGFGLVLKYPASKPFCLLYVGGVIDDKACRWVCHD